MRQKTVLLMTSVFFYASALWAQAPTGADFSWQPEAKKSAVMMDYNFLTGNENLFYYFQRPYPRSGQNDYIVKYDAASNTTTYLPLKLKTEGVKRDWRLVKAYNDTIYIFSSFDNKKQNKYYFFVESVDMNKFALNNNPRMIAEADYNDVKGVKGSDFDLWSSDDGKHFVVSYTLQTKDGSILRYGFRVLDAQFNEVWKFEDDIPKVQGKWFLNAYKIDQNANVYMISRSYDDPKDADKHFERSKLYVKLISKDGIKSADQELSLSGDKFITAQSFVVNPNNELVCAGLYAKKGNESAVGNFSIVLNAGQTSVKNTDSRDFDKAFFTKGMDEDAAQDMEEKVDKGKDFESDFYYAFDNPLLRSDGGLSYIIQKRKLKIQTVYRGQPGTQGSSISYLYNFYYDDIIVLTYDANGKIRWVQKIPQSQRLINGAEFYGGYVENTDADDRMNFIYNLTSNATALAQGSVKKTVCLSLDKDGKESYVELSTGDDGKNFAPLLSRYLGNRKFLAGNVTLKFFIGRLKWGVMNLR